MKTPIDSPHEFSRPFRVLRGKNFRLKSFDPGNIGGLGSKDKPRAKRALQAGIEALADLQEKLYATDRWALLIFQAMDGAGKGSAITRPFDDSSPDHFRVGGDSPGTSTLCPGPHLSG